MIIQELLIALGYKVDSKPLEDAEKAGVEGAEKTESAWAKAGPAVAGVIAGIGAAAVAAAAGVFKLVDESTKAGDEVAKAARASGVAADEFQRLNFAAGRGGASMQQLQAGLKTLTANLDQARRGGAQPFQEALERIGLTTDDLGESAEENMAKIADALQGVASEQDRAAIRMELFGAKAGPGLASMLSEGGDAIREMGKEAERLGLVMGQDALDASESFQDSVSDLRATLGAVVRDIGIEAAPAVQGFTDDLKNWVAENGELLRQDIGGMVNAVAGAMRDALPVIHSVVNGIRNAAEAAQGFMALIDDVGSVRDEDVVREVFARRRAGEQVDAFQVVQERREARERDRAHRAELARRQRAEDVAVQGVLDNIQANTQTMRTLAQRRSTTSTPPKPRGGGGGRSGQRDAVEVSEHEFAALDLFGDDLRDAASRIGATDEQVSEAIRAGGQSLAGHASPDVARRAAMSRLESLTGMRVPAHDPRLMELLGEDIPMGVPDLRLSAVTRGHEPNVVVNTNNITNDVRVEIHVDGSGDPRTVADQVFDNFNQRLVAEMLEPAQRANQVNFAR